MFSESVEDLSGSSLMQEGEEATETEMSSVLGDVDGEDIPIIGTAFGIYNIVEDLTTLGYIDAGFDILIIGLSLAGPEMEPFVMALSAMKMGVEAWYTGITNELAKLPSNASLSDKVTAPFKGILDREIALCKEFTIAGQIYQAVTESNKLEKLKQRKDHQTRR